MLTVMISSSEAALRCWNNLDVRENALVERGGRGEGVGALGRLCRTLAAWERMADRETEEEATAVRQEEGRDQRLRMERRWLPVTSQEGQPRRQDKRGAVI